MWEGTATALHRTPQKLRQSQSQTLAVHTFCSRYLPERKGSAYLVRPNKWIIIFLRHKRPDTFIGKVNAIVGVSKPDDIATEFS